MPPDKFHHDRRQDRLYPLQRLESLYIGSEKSYQETIWAQEIMLNHDLFPTGCRMHTVKMSLLTAEMRQMAQAILVDEQFQK